MKKILLLISLFVLSGALSPAWGKVSTAKTVKKEVAPSSVASRHAILLVLDGVRAQDLYPLLEGGRLPHLKKLFVEEGARFEKATSVFPSTSVSGHQSFFTGLMAGNSGTPQLEWYNAATGEHIDYLTRQGVKHIDWDLFNDRLLTQPDFPVEVDRLAFTLFGLLNPDPTLSVYEIVTAGATEKTHHLPLEALWPGLVSKRFENIDHLAMKTFLKVLKEKSAENFPRFASIALYTGDFIEHEEGADTERMRDAMKQLDAFVGELTALLEEKGLRDKTLIVLSSDHGHHDTGHTVNLIPPLEEWGFTYHRSSDPRKGLRRRDIEYGLRSVSSANLYFPKNSSGLVNLKGEELRHYVTPSGKTVDLIEGFLNLEGVESAVYSEKEGRTVIETKRGRGIIDKTEILGQTLLAYSVEGEDPLRYDTPLLKEWIEHHRFHTAEEWGMASRDLPYPDAVGPVGVVFDDGRAGDLILISSSAYHFLNPDNRWHPKAASHGSLLAGDRLVPLLWGGAGVVPGTHPFGRTIDVAPTLLSWLGAPAPAGLMDGRVLSEVFGKTPPTAPTKNPLQELAASEYAPPLDPSLLPLARREEKRRIAVRERLKKIIDSLGKQSQAPTLSLEEKKRLQTLLAACRLHERENAERLERLERLLSAFP